MPAPPRPPEAPEDTTLPDRPAESLRSTFAGVLRLLRNTALLAFVFAMPSSLQWLTALLHSLR